MIIYISCCWIHQAGPERVASVEQSKWFKDCVSLILGTFSQNSLQRCLRQKIFIQVTKALMHTISTTSALLSNLRVRCWPTQDCCFKDRVKTVEQAASAAWQIWQVPVKGQWITMEQNRAVSQSISQYPSFTQNSTAPQFTKQIKKKKGWIIMDSYIFMKMVF